MAKSIKQKAEKRLAKSAASPINRNLGSRTRELAKVVSSSRSVKKTASRRRTGKTAARKAKARRSY